MGVNHTFFDVASVGETQSKSRKSLSRTFPVYCTNVSRFGVTGHGAPANGESLSLSPPLCRKGLPTRSEKPFSSPSRESTVMLDQHHILRCSLELVTNQFRPSGCPACVASGDYLKTEKWVFHPVLVNCLRGITAVLLFCLAAWHAREPLYLFVASITITYYLGALRLGWFRGISSLLSILLVGSLYYHRQKLIPYLVWFRPSHEVLLHTRLLSSMLAIAFTLSCGVVTLVAMTVFLSVSAASGQGETRRTMIGALVRNITGHLVAAIPLLLFLLFLFVVFFFFFVFFGLVGIVSARLGYKAIEGGLTALVPSTPFPSLFTLRYEPASIGRFPSISAKPGLIENVSTSVLNTVIFVTNLGVGIINSVNSAVAKSLYFLLLVTYFVYHALWVLTHRVLKSVHTAIHESFVAAESTFSILSAIFIGPLATFACCISVVYFVDGLHAYLMAVDWGHLAFGSVLLLSGTVLLATSTSLAGIVSCTQESHGFEHFTQALRAPYVVIVDQFGPALIAACAICWSLTGVSKIMLVTRLQNRLGITYVFHPGPITLSITGFLVIIAVIGVSIQFMRRQNGG